MQLQMQKRLAAQILKASKSNIVLDVNRLEEIKGAITKADLRSLIKDKAIMEKKPRGISRFRIRKIKMQKSKGRRKGPGSIKSGSNARITGKRVWINHIRLQRGFLKLLRNKEVLDRHSYRTLYMKSKGGFFRSKRHLKLYMEEHGLIKNEKQ